MNEEKMKKRSLSLFILLGLIFLASACVFPPIFENGNIGFYFLENDSLARFNPLTQDLDSLELEAEPWLTEEDIVFYDWSAHIMFLNKPKNEILPEFYNDSTNSLNLIEKPFVLAVNNNPAYLGFFKSFFSLTSIQSNPLITELEFMMYPDDVFTYLKDPTLNEDNQNNEALKRALIKNDLFHAGIEVTFDLDYGIHIGTDTSGVSTIEYIINIQNNDVDDLYLLDPIKAGMDLYYMNNLAPHFYGEGDLGNLRASYSIDFSNLPHPSEYDSLANYYLLPSGEDTSMTFSYLCNGVFEIGTYDITSWYKSPTIGMSLDKIMKDNGRIWFGICNFPIYEMTYDGNGIGVITKSYNPPAMYKQKAFYNELMQKYITK